MSELAILGVHHINLSVTDLERSARWYEEVFNLARGWEMPDEGNRGHKIVLLVPNTPLRLVLSLHAGNQGDAFTEFGTGLDHLAFRVADTAELQRWIEKLDRMDVEHSDVKEGATGWFIVLRDPDNIQLELYSDSK